MVLAKIFTRTLIFSIAAVFILGMGALFFYPAIHSSEVTNDMSDGEAEQFIITSLEDCRQSPHQNQCYENIAGIFVEKFTPSFFLKVIAMNEKRPAIFESCHATVHFFGQEVYKKKKDISRALAEGDATCFAGYYHGVLEGYFSEEKILSQMGDDASFADKVAHLCSQTSDKQRNECLHGLGHALMFATDSDVPRALALCDQVPQERANWCYSGVFMENSNSSTSQDHPSKYFKPDDPKYPCSILEEKYLSPCYSIQSQYVVGENSGNWEKSFGFCLVIPPAYRMDCYRAIGTSIAGYTQDFFAMKQACSIPQDASYVEACVSGVIGALGERYNDPFEYAIQFCTLLDEEKDVCYRQVVQLMRSWKMNDENVERNCGSIPDVSYQKMCLENIGSDSR